MEYLDWTLPKPADNLACDEILLEECEESGREVLRVWEPAEWSVVVGYSNPAFREVRLDVCRRLDIPVLRRHSGGGTVLVGPGCLNYALILAAGGDRLLGSIRATNAFVMDRLRKVFSLVTGEPVTVEGHTDLAIRGRKFSGNAQYRRRHAILFHGTVLVGLDIGLIEQTLAVPSSAPAYRGERSHGEFLTNLDVPREAVKRALCDEWRAASPFGRERRAALPGRIASGPQALPGRVPGNGS